MAHYAIGDLQGCFDELTALLAQLDFNHGKDTLWLVGDLVNRGPKSLACLTFAMQHESSVQIVLGNHDLHLLAVLYGYGKLKKQDTLIEIVRHSKVNLMRDWLRSQPLMVQNATHVLLHAGLFPEWTIDEAQNLADEVAQQLSGCHADVFFAQMYGNTPDKWSPDLVGMERWRFITNAFTRMRVLHQDNRLELAYKSTYKHIPDKLSAWFDKINPQLIHKTIVFGHWSALGFVQHRHLLALDTGALWGEELTAVELHSGERFVQPSFQPRSEFVD